MRTRVIADVEASGPTIDGELHVDLEGADFLAVFPLAGKGRARLIGTVRDERADRADALKFADVGGRAIENLKVDVEKVNWFSTYHVHHRVTPHFRKRACVSARRCGTHSQPCRRAGYEYRDRRRHQSRLETRSRTWGRRPRCIARLL